MNDGRIRGVSVTPLGPFAWMALIQNVHAATGWTETTKVYAYTESVRACSLRHLPLGQWTTEACAMADLLFEGHLFTPSHDVRWLAHGDGTYSAWLTKEDQSGALKVEATKRSYYLIGIHSGGGATAFSEARFPDREFTYPVANPPAEHGRGCIEVIEYAPTPRAADSWPEEVDAIERLLNQPAVVAHRFIGVAAFPSGAPKEK